MWWLITDIIWVNIIRVKGCEGLLVCVCVCVCVLADQLTDQGFNVETEISTLKIRVCSIPVKHNLSNALIYQLVVLGPAGEAGSGTFKEQS